jgi:hypothetical protein
VFRVQFTQPQTPAPVIATEENTDIAIALESPTMLRDPFALTSTIDFSLINDPRTRLSLFVKNLDLLPGEDSSAVTAQAQDNNLNVFPLLVEFVGSVPGAPGADGWSQVVVRLRTDLPTNQSVFISVSLRAQTSNKARVRIK